MSSNTSDHRPGKSDVLGTSIRIFVVVGIIITIIAVVGSISGCGFMASPATSASGVKIASAKVPTGPNGLTSEQSNVQRRLVEDNKPGSTKHLYIISAWSGDVIIYSTVKGKVTSGGKRLSPTTVIAGGLGDGVSGNDGTRFEINGETFYTTEVVQDDGTFGSSGQYLYWWDTADRYHQHYLSGGQIVHISDHPISVPKVIINMDESG